MKTMIPSEHQEQAAFFEMILLEYRDHPEFVRMLLFAVPNGAWLGGRFPPALMDKMKQEGLTPGVADILYLQPRGMYAFLAIEMKRSDQRGRKGGGLREDQVLFLEAAKGEGARTAVCYSAEEARAVFAEYMDLK